MTHGASRRGRFVGPIRAAIAGSVLALAGSPAAAGPDPAPARAGSPAPAVPSAWSSAAGASLLGGLGVALVLGGLLGAGWLWRQRGGAGPGSDPDFPLRTFPPSTPPRPAPSGPTWCVVDEPAEGEAWGYPGPVLPW
ncbi:MAG TPA: hypothetical protein VG406_02900 [Isosphaeraceae bacterium]|nr:hypothetical protein [Isosphaeraceae bacterium]